jgi:hypothetical protein
MCLLSGIAGDEGEGIAIKMYSDVQVQISVHVDWCTPGSFQCAPDRGLA